MCEGIGGVGGGAVKMKETNEKDTVTVSSESVSQQSIISSSLRNPSYSCVERGTITARLSGGRKPLRCREEESSPEKVIQ